MHQLAFAPLYTPLLSQIAIAFSGDTQEAIANAIAKGEQLCQQLYLQ